MIDPLLQHFPSGWVERQDTGFFAQHRQRSAHIRKPFGNECVAEFESLGEHKRDRRRIIIYKVPEENPLYDPRSPQLLKIPYLLFADETIEDEDRILLPIIDYEMKQAAIRYAR